MPHEAIRFGTHTRHMQRLPGETTADMYLRWDSFRKHSDVFTEIPAEMAATFLTMTEYALIGELLARGGACITSQWTTGSGRLTQKAAVPPFARDWMRVHTVPTHVASVFSLHRRAKTVIGFSNLPWVRKCFHEATKILLERTK